MSSLVNQIAPDFTAEAILGNGTFGKLRLSAYRSKYVVLLFYPMDFSLVCPSEIIAFDRAREEFEALNTQILGISVDSTYSHHAWRNMPPTQGGIGEVHFPLISDITKDISRMYGVLINESAALRALFLIDREGVVQHQLVNNLSFGRKVDETIRMIEALQFKEKHGEVCPANWVKGAEAMKPTLAGAVEYLSKHS